MAAEIPALPDDAPAGAGVGAAAEPPPTTDILGVPLALTDYERTMDWMDATIVRREKGYICVAATHTVVACQDDPELRDAVMKSSLTVPDGQPLVWAMNAMGSQHLDGRVYGPELMARYCERSALTGARM
ncbi:MAG TPA: glycosyltransferase, partial [Baekduia sp.]|nr:glycosyltransferase [Baekduia sp.]